MKNKLTWTVDEWGGHASGDFRISSYTSNWGGRVGERFTLRHFGFIQRDFRTLRGAKLSAAHIAKEPGGPLDPARGAGR